MPPSGCARLRIYGGRSSNKSARLVNKQALSSYRIPHDFDHLHHMCIMKFSWLMHWPVRRLIQTELKCLLEDHVYTYHPSITDVHWFKVFSPFWILLKSFFFFVCSVCVIRRKANNVCYEYWRPEWCGPTYALCVGRERPALAIISGQPSRAKLRELVQCGEK